MTFLPIVARELRVAARRPGTSWVRSGAALGILVIGTWYFLMYSGRASAGNRHGLVLDIDRAARCFTVC